MKRHVIALLSLALGIITLLASGCMTAKFTMADGTQVQASAFLTSVTDLKHTISEGSSSFSVSKLSGDVAMVNALDQLVKDAAAIGTSTAATGGVMAAAPRRTLKALPQPAADPAAPVQTLAQDLNGFISAYQSLQGQITALQSELSGQQAGAQAALQGLQAKSQALGQAIGAAQGAQAQGQAVDLGPVATAYVLLVSAIQAAMP